jgi:hypothetical protein
MRRSARAAKGTAVLLFVLLVAGSCGGDRAVREGEAQPPAKQTFPASKEGVMEAAIEGLVNRGYVVEFMDRGRGIIRTAQRITRDPGALLEGQRHRVELNFEQTGPQETVVTVRPYFQKGVAGGLEWFDMGPPADLPDVEETVLQAIAAQLEP